MKNFNKTKIRIKKNEVLKNLNKKIEYLMEIFSKIPAPLSPLICIKEAVSEGVLIHGLYLEGCRFKNGLEDPEGKKMFAPLPILHVTA